MTLILSSMSVNKTVQISDRRLTWPNGRIEDDAATKAILVYCQDARFSIAFTGLAELGGNINRRGVRTDIWLFDLLKSIGANLLPANEIMSTINVRLHDAISSTHIGKKYKGLTLVFSGFYGQMPFISTLSNQEDQMRRPIKEIREVFTWVNSQFQGTVSEATSRVIGSGATQALGPDAWRRMRKLRDKGFFYNSHGEMVARHLLSHIRRASQNKKFGYLIGEDCYFIFIPSDNNAHAIAGDFTKQKVASDGSLNSVCSNSMPHLILAPGSVGVEFPSSYGTRWAPGIVNTSGDAVITSVKSFYREADGRIVGIPTNDDPDSWR